VERLQAQAPSPRARELAAHIPSDADPYALALKAMAERRFDDARPLLEKAQRDKEVELARIYQARGQIEYYAGRYAEAVAWYRKAVTLRPTDPNLLTELGVALGQAGRYAEAEPFLQHAFAFRVKALGPEHPEVATSLGNLALLYHSQGRSAEAEPLFKRALMLGERRLGPSHPTVLTILQNYVVHLQHTSRQAEAEPLIARIQASQPPRGWLGLQLVPQDDEQGIRVQRVMVDSPAARAGFQPGDVIIRCQGRVVQDVTTFVSRVAALPPGTAVDCDVRRNGQPHVLHAIVGRRPVVLP
jgi:tetratricopeptide (TPR) repeat protein